MEFTNKKCPHCHKSETMRIILERLPESLKTRPETKSVTNDPNIDLRFWASTLTQMSRGLNDKVTNCGYLLLPEDEEDTDYIDKKTWDRYIEHLKELIFLSRFGHQYSRAYAIKCLEDKDYKDLMFDGHFNRVWNHCKMTLKDYVTLAKIYGPTEMEDIHKYGKDSEDDG